MGVELDLRRLRYFIEVVRQGGFSPAGKVLFATQSTVSKAVKQLETELGADLLLRLGGRTELTAAGRAVYERGLQLLATSAELTRELEELRGLRRGTLQIGVAAMGTSSLFGVSLADLQRRFPGVEVRMIVQSVPDLVAGVRNGAIEVAALFDPIPADLEARCTHSDELMVLLPPSHPLAARTRVSIADLQGWPLVLFEEGMPANDAILRAFGELGAQPTVAARTGQPELMFQLVASGIGIGFVPRRLAESRPHRSVPAVPLDAPGIAWNISLAWRRGSTLSHAAQAWLDSIAPSAAGDK